VRVEDLLIDDAERARHFPCTLWRPDPPAAAASLVFSHHAGGHRRSSSFLCEHLAAHGYVVAALDHSEVAAPELTPRDSETPDERGARVGAISTSRVPDLQLLLDHLNADRVGAIGHSLGGWTVLAAAQADPRVASVVALAPGGSAQPRPGVLKLPLDQVRPVPTLYLTGDKDVPIPVEHVFELFRETPGAAMMCVLRDADHQHFVDDVAVEHEQLRALQRPGEAAWMRAAMLPIDQLCPPDEAHRFACGLALAHLDTTLRANQAATTWLAQLTSTWLAARGIHASVERRPQDGRRDNELGGISAQWGRFDNQLREASLGTASG
jgi:predicted dienelactone hydrolase